MDDIEQGGSREALAPGARVDHFQVVRLIGRGGMGEVYLARDTLLGRKVALKVIHGASLGDARERFLFEARVTARFSHPHIVTVYAVGEQGGNPYVALEYLEGQDLRERIRGERLGPGEIVRIGLAIAEALSEAHRAGVLHRDLKPENVLLPRDGRLRVVDFGLAKALPADDETLARTLRVGESLARAPRGGDAFRTEGTGFAGTPLYMAPEQWHRRECDAKVDVWALGVILFELIEGRRPFPGTEFWDICDQVISPHPAPPLGTGSPAPPELARLVARCLDKDPGRRPSSAEVVEILSHLGRRSEIPRDPGESPFRGLLPFGERHADLFFGRDGEVAAFVERLRDTAALAVVGPSGAGKSSFIQAGVVPRLRDQGRWQVLELRPGRRPFATLAARLARGEAESSRSGSGGDSRATSGSASEAGPPVDREAEERLAAELTASPGRLALELQRLAQRERTRVLLFVDQAEELFSQVADEDVRRRFMDAVSQAADDPEGPIRAVLTLRDDFLVRFSETERARELLGRIAVLRSPGPEALREILVRPLEAVGYRWEDEALVGEMVAAIGNDPASLPLLQFACSQLWEARDREARTLTRQAYSAMGGVEGALVRQADALLDALIPARLETARDLLLRLVTPEGARRTVSRDDLIDGLGPEAGAVVDRLVEERVLVSRKGRDGGSPRADVEIIHESLIRGWARLRRWLEESREDLAFAAELSQAAALWERQGSRDEDAWQGATLADALRRAARIESLDARSRRFLAAGRRVTGRRTRRKRIAIATLLATLAAVAALLGLLYREARGQRAEALAQRERAELGRAEALRDGARVALSQGSVLEARAKARMSLEIADSVHARSVWRRLEEIPLLWESSMFQVIDLDWAPNGATIAAVLGGPAATIDAETGEMIATFQGERLLFSVDHSPDGRFLVTSGSDIAVWDAASGREIRAINPGYPMVMGVRVSPDGRLIAAPVGPGGIGIWALATGERLRVLEAEATTIAFSGGGGRLVSAGTGGTVQVWDTATGKRLARFENPGRALTALAASRDGKLAAAAGPGGAIAVCDLEAGRLDRTIATDVGPSARLAFHPDGRRLAATGPRGAVDLWDALTGEHLRRLADDMGAVAALAFDSTGTRLVAGDSAGLLRVWRVEGVRPARARRGHDGIWLTAAFSADGSLLATGERESPEILLWDGGTGMPRGAVRGHEGGVLALAFDPASGALASASKDGSVRIADPTTSASRAVLLDHGAPVSALAYSPDGSLLATGDTRGGIRLRDGSSGAVRARTQGHHLGIHALAFSPDGSELASSSHDGTVRTWDARTGAAREALFEGPERRIGAVAYSPDGRWIAHGDGDRSLLLRDRARGGTRVFRTVQSHVRTPFNRIAFHRGGAVVGSAIGDAEPRRLWEIATGREVAVVRNTFGPGSVLLFSPDGRFGASDDTSAVRLWDAVTGHRFWRGSPLLPDLPRLFTHRGWIDPSTGDLAPPPAGSRWREAVERPVTDSDASRDGTLVCVLTTGGDVEIWDRERDTLLARGAFGGAEWIKALPGGCIAGEQTSQETVTLRLLPTEGAAVELSRGATALEVDREGILVAEQGRVIAFDRGGKEAWRVAVDGTVQCLARVGGAVAAAFLDTHLELIAPGSGEVERRSLRDHPALGLWVLEEISADIIAGGSASGAFGIWHLPTGELLYDFKLNGIPQNLVRRDNRLFATTEIGDFAVVDLEFLERDRCALLREIWRSAPVTWKDGRAIAAPPPAGHPCAGR